VVVIRTAYPERSGLHQQFAWSAAGGPGPPGPPPSGPCTSFGRCWMPRALPIRCG